MSDFEDLTGTFSTMFHVGGPCGPSISQGIGNPNQVLSGYPGDLYFDQDGLLWVKEFGEGTGDGWVSK